jgi:DNA-binding transcriptional LysR family regulator
MNLQRFQHFIAVAEEGSFTRAARRVGMRQPPLSQSIRRLEKDLGVTLLDRTPFGVMLTESGAAFLAEAREAVAAANRAVTRSRTAARPGPQVRLGIVSLALFELLPSLLAVAQDLKLAIDINYSSTNDQVLALAHGDLDIGLLTPPFDAPRRMRVTLLEDEPLVAALPASLAGSDPTVSLSDLHEHLILFPRPDGPVLYDAIVNLFRTAGLPLNNKQETPASMLATLALVAAGTGASLVPAAVARNVSMNGLAFRPLDRADSATTWPIALAHMPLSAGSPALRLLQAWDKYPRKKADVASPRI